MSHWIAMHCTPEREMLQEKYPAAWLLLCQIATRTKYRDCPISGLRFGQAQIGDFERAGILSRGIYRQARKVLEECEIASFSTTSRGTVATLSDSRIFSIRPEDRNPSATGQPPSDRQPAAINTHRHRDTETQREDADSASFSLCSRAVKAKRTKKHSPETMPDEMQRLMESAPPQSRLRHGEAARVAREWRAIPAGDRPSGETLQLAMERWKASARWVNEGGRYIMALHRWVRERCWRELPAPPTAAPVAAIPKFIPSFPGERPPKP